DAVAVDEVVHVAAAPGEAQRAVDLGNRDTQRAGLLDVDVEAELRCVLLAVRTHAGQQRTLRGSAQQLVARGDQRFVALSGVVLQIDVEAARRAELHHRWWRHREGHGVLDLHQRAHGTAGDGLDRGLRRGALVPVLQLDEGHAVVLAAARKAEALHGEYRLDVLGLVLEEMLFDLLPRLLRALLGATDRRLHDGEKDALVLVRQERRRYAQEQETHRNRQRDVDQQEAAAARNDAANALPVAAVSGIQLAVEPAE